ncbi:MAG: tRNA pseudouridine(55) synthase TruB, partial [Gemmatimonadaceae bacterium]
DVEVYSWDGIRFQDDSVAATITCSGGTYIRSLARDLGRLTSSAAHLESLRRTRVGRFDVKDAPTLESLTSSPRAITVLRVVADA